MLTERSPHKGLFDIEGTTLEATVDSQNAMNVNQPLSQKVPSNVLLDQDVEFTDSVRQNRIKKELQLLSLI